MATTKIEWATDVWNPVTGCQKVSQGCKNCYAERLAGRFWGDRKFTDVQVHPDRLDQPLKWRKPRRIFVSSMSDLFHEDVPTSFIGDVVDVMGSCPQHTFMILTKRPQRMADLWRINSAPGGVLSGGLSNAWLGVSAEDQKTADERIPYLLQTPAAVRFLSCEPLLGPIDLGFPFVSDNPLMVQRHVDWVIAGGEGGPGARPMHPDWARGLRDQCVSAGVPFFFKQWGGVRKKAAGRMLDGRTYDEFPPARTAPIADRAARLEAIGGIRTSFTMG